MATSVPLVDPCDEGASNATHTPAVTAQLLGREVRLARKTVSASRAGHVEMGGGGLKHAGVLLLNEMVETVAVDGVFAAAAAYKAGVVRRKLVAHATRALAKQLMCDDVRCHASDYCFVCSKWAANPNCRRNHVIQDSLKDAVQAI